MARRSLTSVAALFLALVGVPSALGAQARPGASAFVDGNALFAAQRYADAVLAYRAAVAADPSLGEAHFFLANALDNQYIPARRGQPANDRLLEDAREHYILAAGLLTRPEQGLIRKRSLQFLAALYGRDKLDRPDEAEAVIRQLIALEPGDVTSLFALAKVHEDAGRIADAEAVLIEAQAAAPDRAEVWSQTAQFFNRQNRFDEAMAAITHLTRLDPADPQPFYQLAVFYEEKVRKDFTLGRPQQTEYLTTGLAAVDQALALRPEYFEALTYKNLILRQQARLAGDPQAQRRLLEEADRLQSMAIEVRNRQSSARPRP